MQLQGERYSRAIKNIFIEQPQFAHEGMAGYIETKVTFTIADLKTFSELYNEWYSFERRSELYHLVKEGKCL
jgi:hypothetical protein